MLGPHRVLDLTDGRGAFAGHLLAQMGADVVMIEPPKGAQARLLPPFVGDEAGVERSLVHHAFNRGKRSAVVDLHSDRGRADFERLVGWADVLLETGGPAERRALGRYGSDDLFAINPRLVHGILSPFGSTGPKADWAGSDLVVAAAGAQLSITGNPDMAPLRTSVPQTWLHASADLALGALLGLTEREASGRGQVIDISAAHSWIDAGFHYPLFSSWGEPDTVRNGSHVRIGPVGSTFDFPAKNGHITLTLLFGAAVGPFTTRFVQWMVEEGACDPSFGDIDYATYDPSIDVAHFESLKAAINAFTSTKTKEELDAAAWERRLLVAPVHTLTEVLAMEHFADRGVYRSVAVGEASARVPGPIAQAEPPLYETSSAPRLGEHTAEVLAAAAATNPAAAADPSGDPHGDGSTRRPLTGVKVLDLTISFAGPIIGRILAAHGATVVKVESQQRPDLTRTAGVFMAGDTVDHSGCFATYNANKLSLGMNLTKPGASDVLDDMVRWADVLVCSFAPGALDRMGLDQERRRQLNPDLITMQSSLLGQTGSLSGLAGYGNMAAAVCGFFATTGWPGRTPVGPMGAYTDIISPRFAAGLIIAALDHLRRTGEPSDFDFGQGESCLQLLTLGMLDTQLNARSWERMGNEDHFNAPHGVYPSLGDDEWTALSVQTDQQWQALVALIGGALTDVTDRFGQGDVVDRAISEWTRARPARDAEVRLQEAGIAAHGVQNGSHCRTDPQLEHRRWCVEAAHERIGPVMINTSPIQLSRTPATFAAAGPTLGQHTYDVLTELLGYDADRIAELAIAEVLE